MSIPLSEWNGLRDDVTEIKTTLKERCGAQLARIDKVEEEVRFQRRRTWILSALAAIVGAVAGMFR